MVFCYLTCSSDQEKLLIFKAEGWEFAKFLISLEQFNRMLFYLVPEFTKYNAMTQIRSRILVEFTHKTVSTIDFPCLEVFHQQDKSTCDKSLSLISFTKVFRKRKLVKCSLSFHGKLDPPNRPPSPLLT